MEVNSQKAYLKKRVEPDKLNLFAGFDNRVFELNDTNITYYVPFKNYYRESENCYKNWGKRFSLTPKSLKVIHNTDVKTNKKNLGCNIHLINCGHGDSILVENNGEYALIDFGGRDSYKQNGEMQPPNNVFAVDKNNDSCIVKYCKQHVKGNTIKAAIISHLHEDHIFDIDKFSQNFEIENLFMLKTFHGEKFKGKNTYKLLDKANADTINFIDIEDIKERKANSFKIGHAKFEIIGPVEDIEDLNGNSLVLLMSYNNMKVLFTGDMTKRAERNVIDHCKRNNINLKDVSILKVAHHGSDTSSSSQFLKELGDNLTCVISCGCEDKCKQTEELRKKGVVYKTSEDGDVTIKLLPKIRSYVVDTQKQKSIKVPESVLKDSRVLGKSRRESNPRLHYVPERTRQEVEENYAS